MHGVAQFGPLDAMNIAAIIVFGIIGIAVFFSWANNQARKQHERFTKSDVISALENVISIESVSHDEWDLFLAWPILDPYLESVRMSCLQISFEHSDEPGRDLSVAGEAKVRSILKELYDRI